LPIIRGSEATVAATDDHPKSVADNRNNPLVKENHTTNFIHWKRSLRQVETGGYGLQEEIVNKTQ